MGIVLRIISSRHTRRRAFQVNRFYSILNIRALSDEIAEVLPGDFALSADLTCLFAFGAKLLN